MSRYIGRTPLLLAGLLLAIWVVATTASASTVDLLALWCIEGVLALSLVLVWGHAGILSLGQTAIAGLGGYAFAIVAVSFASEAWFFPVSVAAGLILGALFAAALGYFMFYGRVNAVNVAVITLAVTIILYIVFNATSDPGYKIGSVELGGYNGIVGVPQARLGPETSSALNIRVFFLVCALMAVAAGIAVWLFRRSRTGRVVAAIRCNEGRAELLGHDIRAYKLVVFVFGGCLAGLAGAMLVARSGFVGPTVFALNPAIFAVIWVLVGGRGSIIGGFVGVFLVESLNNYLAGSQGQYAPIYLGMLLLVMVLVFPSGLMELVNRLNKRFFGHRSNATGHQVALIDKDAKESVDRVLQERPHGVELQAVDIHKDFGGFSALAGVDADFSGTGIRCIVGPNGAGKSTFFSLLSGIARPTTGRILLNGVEITDLALHKRADAGIGVKLQVVTLFSELNVYENLWLATRPGSGRDERVDMLLRDFGLADVAATLAGELSHGRQQWVDIAMAVASDPAILLLDEPTAGMSSEETLMTADLVKRLARHAVVIVIEHDMGFIRMLNSPVMVFHLGRVLMEASLAEVERDQTVLDIYLGRGHVSA